ncbi:MAG: PTS sugar transporter subunit IIA [Fusobacteriaceae bacterium]|jgi:nitrogen PTS system EIIA component|nr:PTS sugar transporter subunit IIA [Fusobacteriaceae bacterium]MBP9597070.1 PTS sugar transporter subunit IIA [Fusobacteriaceae bacterium]MBU9919254.1 PTS sugar transporter subunit IIA [Fusobacteriaceae bacterium]
MKKKLSDLIKKENVVFLETIDMVDTIEVLTENAINNQKIKDKESFKNAVLEREELVSTGIGLGVALPHTKSKDIEEFFIVIGINKEGIDWDAIDRNPVGIVFLIGGPEAEDSQKEYLQIVSKLMLLIKNKERRISLLNSENAQEIADIFEKF